MALEEDLGETATAAIEECAEAEDGTYSLVWALPSGNIQACGLELDGTQIQVIPVAPAQSGRSGIFVAQPKTDSERKSAGFSADSECGGVLSPKNLTWS